MNRTLQQLSIAADVIGWILLTIVSFQVASMCKIKFPTYMRIMAGIGFVLVMLGLFVGIRAKAQ